ncbi:ankyrin repeat domain-containing protein [Maridesulfovibrio sp.]|uniref:ankyrin repeat domain-containing protein n=1 Tax=Maridesulfovibrio sp. TaxID=2795000 RepID=UPI0029CA9CBE|nr:ankyrin repeat domain-containing protein [Maridesulfovibrio sp.]
MTISTLAALIIALILTVNIIIDPYGEFRLIEGNYNKLKFKNLKSSALKVASKLYDGQYTLVFGSSRTMLVSEEILGEPVLNFSTSIYVNPGDILALLKTLDEKQIKNIKQIYYLIDINSFHYESSAPELASKAALFMESFRNIGPDKIEDAWKCVKNNVGPEPEHPNFIDEFGVLHKKDESYKDNVVVFNSHFVSQYYLDKLAEINSFCIKNRVKITYFTVPWCQNLNTGQQAKLNAILNSAISSCSSYYDLFGNTDFTGHKNLFSDPTHLTSTGLKKLFNKRYWTQDKIKYARATPTTHPNFKEMKKDDFFTYITKHPQLVDTGFIDEIHKLGRDDLVLYLYDKGIAVEAMVGKSFFLDKPSVLKMILSSGRNFNKNMQANNVNLHYAIMSGITDGVKNAILLGADVNNQIAGTTPLIVALKSTKGTEMLSLLLKSGADINYINKYESGRQDFKQSLFTFALAKNNQKQLDFLLSYAPDSPLAKHARLVLELRKNPGNATAYNKYLVLQNKYYGN